MRQLSLTAYRYRRLLNEKYNQILNILENYINYNLSVKDLEKSLVKNNLNTYINSSKMM